MQHPANVLNQLQQTAASGQAAYANLQKAGYITYHPIANIDCSILPAPVWQKKQPAPVALNYIWHNLPSNDLPCVYCFEIVSPDTETILGAYRNFKANKDFEHRARPALKKKPTVNTQTLYVGKVLKDIGGRMVVHFGYYDVGSTAGLQLVCWANEAKLKLHLHIYAFKPEMHDFVAPLEFHLAQKLHPLIGKHRL